jgi:hypothetical protein
VLREAREDNSPSLHSAWGAELQSIHECVAAKTTFSQMVCVPRFFANRGNLDVLKLGLAEFLGVYRSENEGRYFGAQHNTANIWTGCASGVRRIDFGAETKHGLCSLWMPPCQESVALAGMRFHSFVTSENVFPHIVAVRVNFIKKYGQGG